jgi:ribosomal protein S18 acetylase RimI-like enzyme
MKIRSYKDSDKNLVISLWKKVFNPQKPHNDPKITINMKIKQNDGLFFVVEENNQIIGTIIAGFDGHRGWLYSLALHPQHRRKGIGSKLVKKSIKELKKLGCLKVNLQINSDNDEVVEFYKKNGFLVEDRISMGIII